MTLEKGKVELEEGGEVLVGRGRVVQADRPMTK